MCELCDAVKNSMLKHSIPLTLTVDEIAVVQADAERLLGGERELNCLTDRKGFCSL